MKRILSIILVLIMVINLSSCSIFKKYGNVKIKFDKKTAVLTVSGEGEIHNYHPHHKDDLEEYDDGTIKKVVIEEGITYIKNSFNHLVKLESIEFPSSLHTIEESFIETEELSILSIPATVKKIFNKSFNYSGISDLKFNAPIEITTSFELIDIKSVRIPKNSVLSSAFNYCLKLEEIVVEEGVAFENIISENGSSYPAHGFKYIVADAKFYVYEPLYKGEDKTSVANSPKYFWDCYLPVIIPKGEDYKKYEDKFKTNEEALGLGVDFSEHQGPHMRYEVKLPEE